MHTVMIHAGDNQLMRSSPIFSLILGTRTFIVLSEDVVVQDLLDKRSNIYSSRPDMYIGMDLASGGLRVLLMVSVQVLCDGVNVR